MTIINGHEAWDAWERNGGAAQSHGFMHALLDACASAYLPLAEFTTAADIGCALGDGTAVLYERLPGAMISGYDISPAGIERAAAQWEALPITWICGTPDDPLPLTADFMTCSNVLEHLDHPIETLTRWLCAAHRAFAVLVPFRQQLLDGVIHKHRFGKSDFPEHLSGHALICLRTVTVPFHCWQEPQLFALYMRL